MKTKKGHTICGNEAKNVSEETKTHKKSRVLAFVEVKLKMF
jgi:hypothetical protein